MANKTIAEERKPKIVVKGIVDFYGHVDNYNKDGKEYVLTLRDYSFSNLDAEEVKSWYTNEKGKTDLPTQWGAAVGRLPAEWTTKMAVVDGFPILADDGLGEDEDQQVPGVALADVMGSNLPGDGEHAACRGVHGVEKSFFRHDGQKIHGSRQPGNFQCEA